MISGRLRAYFLSFPSGSDVVPMIILQDIGLFRFFFGSWKLWEVNGYGTGKFW
jgi:hypothetical protein